MGRLVPFKGQEYLLTSFAAVSKNRPGTRLMIVGDGELEAPLGRTASELGIAGRTIFTGFRDDIPSLYSAMDVYVHSSVEGGGETFPFAVLQALAFGLPTVVTEVGEVGSMVEKGVTGFAVRDRDPGVFAEALATLLDDPALRASMGREGRNLLMKKSHRRHNGGRGGGGVRLPRGTRVIGTARGGSATPDARVKWLCFDAAFSTLFTS